MRFCSLNNKISMLWNDKIGVKELDFYEDENVGYLSTSMTDLAY